MERRKRLRKAAYVVGGVAVVGAIVAFVTLSGGNAALSGEERRLLDQAPQATSAAGCGEVQTVDPYSPANQDSAHIGVDIQQLPRLSTYPTQPPTSGPHSGSTLAAGVYTNAPPMDQAIHSLEHGAVILWYNPETVPAAELAEVQSFFREGDHQDHMIVAPYNYPDQGEAGTLPDGQQMAMVAWHHLQACDDLSLPVAFSFVNSYKSPNGDAPENGAPI